MSIRIRIAGAALSLFCFACGGGGSTGPSLTISPATLTVTSGSTPAGFTATLTGSTTAIAWSLSGPGSISTTAGTSTTYTPPASLAASTTAILTATSGSLTASATITINPPAINLTISPQTLTVAAGRSSTTFTATLTGSSNAISWSLSGPGSISTMAGATTSYTPPISVTSTTTATLTVTAGASLTASATITINVPTPITVTGTLVYWDNSPVASAAVNIGTQHSISDVNGSFTIPGVTPPYDVIAISSLIGVVYQQLTLTAPTIVFPILNPTAPNKGKVTGQIMPATLLGTAGYNTIVAWGAPETSIYGVFSNGISSNPYSLTNFLQWYGPTSITGNLHVIQEQVGPGGYPTSFPGYGMSQGVTITSPGPTTAPTLNMTSTAVATLSGTVTLPPSYGIFVALLSLEFLDGATMLLGDGNLGDGGVSSTFTLATPSGIDGTIDVEALAEDIPGNDVLSGTIISGLMPNATTASLAVLAGSTPGSPSDSATGITTATEFTWTPFAGGINFVIFTPSSSTNPTYFVFTGATSTAIPNLSTQGLGLPTASLYSWQIYGLAPFANLDAFASKNFLTPLAENGVIAFKPPSNFPVYSYSLTINPRTFTTQ